VSRLQEALAGPIYEGYSYAYPHKSAYRPLEPAVPLAELWQAERRDALFLYLHVPFCEMRCGFCNLFARPRPEPEIERAYLAALRRQTRALAEALGDARFARAAIGGGTPTYLAPRALEELFDLAELLGARPAEVPVSVEVSPETLDAGRLEVLLGRGADRISIGVQSFVEAEVAAAGRPQQASSVERALRLLRASPLPTLNVDLIYGLPRQTPKSWLASVQRALEWAPEELYLYPLYVRPLTGLGRAGRGAEEALRPRMYREARDLLLSAGYRQQSMRLFRASGAPETPGPVYCCQEDGMVGLGAGARSYTTALHYSAEYAVGARGVREIIQSFLGQSDIELSVARHGFRLDGGEQRRRWAIQSLLLSEGLDRRAYEARFGTSLVEDLPELDELVPLALAEDASDRLRLTAAGIERSDTIGPWLASGAVRERMQEYELR
jgi:oxygen-independent coproporphyrinogen III oxidase